MPNNDDDDDDDVTSALHYFVKYEHVNEPVLCALSRSIAEI